MYSMLVATIWKVLYILIICFIFLNTSSSGTKDIVSPLSLIGNTGSSSTTSSKKSHHISQLNLSHHILCEPISQFNDLKNISCPNENQFMIILEAYYSDLYPEHVCSSATVDKQSKLTKLTGSQLVSIFRQLYSPVSRKLSKRFNEFSSTRADQSQDHGERDSDQDETTSTSSNNNGDNDGPHMMKYEVDNDHDSLIQWAPTLTGYSNSNPFCLDDLRQSFSAKCSGRQHCRFSRKTDHQFPACAQLKPGHVFARYLCVDSALLIKYCNADALLASHSTVLNRVKRNPSSSMIQQSPQASFYDSEQELPLELHPEEQPDQIDTLDFGFVSSPGYPRFYATSNSGGTQGGTSNCAWTIEAEEGQRVTVKLLDASLAPSQMPLESAYLNTDLKIEDETARKARQLLLASLRLNRAKMFSNNNNNNSSSLTSISTPSTAAILTTTSINDTTNLIVESIDSAGGQESPNRKVLFRIDHNDYESIRTSLFNKLKLVDNQCQDYDKLIIRDSILTQQEIEKDQGGGEDKLVNDGNNNMINHYEQTPPTNTVLQAGSNRDLLINGITNRTNNNLLKSKLENVEKLARNKELELITKLPVTLYKNDLINFENHSIYRDNKQQQHNTNNNHQLTNKRIDYTALLDSLNPLELIWLYQNNISLCSNSQQDQLSSQQQKNRVSFTSTSHKIQVNLVSGHMFNPSNRGVLFWYHKHGCPTTIRAPRRARIVEQSESMEVFECFSGFVFNDTRLSKRIRKCSHLDQRWLDIDPISMKANVNVFSNSQRLPSCVYAGDLTTTNNNNIDSSGAISEPLQSQQDPHTKASLEDVAVEVVGVNPTATANSGTPFDSEVVIGVWNEEDQGILNQQQLQQQRHILSNSSSLENFLAILSSLISGPKENVNNGKSGDYHQTTNQPSIYGSNSITHEPIRDASSSIYDNQQNRYQGGSRRSSIKADVSVESSAWNTLKGLLDKRLIIPAIVILTIFLIINFAFYVIFIIALPKLVRCACSKSNSPKRKSKYNTKTKATTAIEGGCLNNINDTNNNYTKLKQQSTMISSKTSSTGRLHHHVNNKLSYYETDYSVTMGMSL